MNGTEITSEDSAGWDYYRPALSDFFRTQIVDKAKDIGPLIYHYTDAHGLNGIVKENKIRFSHTGLLNDTSEVGHSLTVLAEILHKVFSQKTEAEQTFANDVFNAVKGTFVNLQPVVFCLSKKENLLNQWRYYGKAKVSYCIGLETKSLLNTFDYNFPAQMTDIIYNSGNQHELVEDLVALIYDNTLDALKSGALNAATRASFVSGSAREITIVLCALKDPAFDDEREVRLVAFHRQTDAPLKPSFAQKDAGIFPFFEWMKKDGTKLPVRTIMTSPSPYNERNLFALNYFLEAIERSDIRTQCSRIPLSMI